MSATGESRDCRPIEVSGRYMFDYLIQGGRIVDGSGSPWHHCDVALNGDRIASVAPPGSTDPLSARKLILTDGGTVCPGFIDILSQSMPSLLRDPKSLSKITQGVTTEIVGEGSTPAPFGGRRITPFAADELRTIGPASGEWEQRARTWRTFGDWLETIRAHPTAVNVGAFLGGGTVREFVKGYDPGPASQAEVRAMQQLVASAMQDGALGLSTALIYPPGSFATTEELTSLVKTVSGYGGIYATHLRSEGDRLLEALDEAIKIGQVTRVPVEIFHLKAAGERNWPKLPQALDRIEFARALGTSISADMYPYTAAGTGLTAGLPPWAGSEAELFEHLHDPIWRRRIKAETTKSTPAWESLIDLAGLENVFPFALASSEYKRYRGKSLAHITTARRQVWIDTVLDLLASERQRIFTVYQLMKEENQRLGLEADWMKIGSDGSAYDPAWAAAEGPVHPRSYGTFPRVLGYYVREQKVLRVEAAIRKMTSASAEGLGLIDRGLIEPGMYADVVIFDPAEIGDEATYEDPHRLSRGVSHVWVNGVQVVEHGQFTGALPGRILTGVGSGI